MHKSIFYFDNDSFFHKPTTEHHHLLLCYSVSSTI